MLAIAPKAKGGGFCGECGASYDRAGQKFCMECGTPIEGGAALGADGRAEPTGTAGYSPPCATCV